MKLKTQVVLVLLFLCSFLKSFKYDMKAYDTVFILVVALIYLSTEYLTEQKTKKELEKLTVDIDTRLKLQNEEIERVKNNTSKMALNAGIRRS